MVTTKRCKSNSKVETEELGPREMSLPRLLHALHRTILHPVTPTHVQASSTLVSIGNDCRSGKLYKWVPALSSSRPAGEDNTCPLSNSKFRVAPHAQLVLLLAPGKSPLPPTSLSLSRSPPLSTARYSNLSTSSNVSGRVLQPGAWQRAERKIWQRH